MQVFNEIGAIKAFIQAKRRQGQSIGLVPTMGALHQGHLTLIETSKQENDVTICSIFVNPTQFNNPQDLVLYPRTFELDAEMLTKVGCDAIFYPSNTEMYPEVSTVKFDFGPLDKVMEGQYRPGHFSGVALIVTKLFNICEPDKAYFGQKDWQQFAIISQLVRELNFSIQLKSVPTVREDDGLAMSSRNMRLGKDERKWAVVFYQALKWAHDALLQGESIQKVKEQVSVIIEQNPGARLEYFEVADSVNLMSLKNVEGEHQPIMCIAGYVGNVRLIDNMFLDLSQKRS